MNQKIKVVKTTYTQIIQAPLHVVEAFEINRRLCVYETLDQFRLDSKMTTLKQLDLGDYISFEVLEMFEEEFNKLREFSPVA